jgi:hypothetical protein
MATISPPTRIGGDTNSWASSWFALAFSAAIALGEYARSPGYLKT